MPNPRQPPNCSTEHSFDIAINTTPTVDTPADISECDSYTLPALTNGNYFTASNGAGTALNVEMSFLLPLPYLCMQNPRQPLTVALNILLIFQLL